ncbi:MAG: PIN domain-containing protein [Ardenticatenaceae bacterium]|nr:PIN domain-containing protein [Ardenticatenaceae bacterium]
MIYLDTHIVVWLYAGLTDKFSETARALINDHELFISPIVRLELAYLREIERLTTDSNAIISDLAQRIGLQICDKAFNLVVQSALALPWTRDPFDRLIVANAAVHDDILLSKDSNILTHYTFARW